MKYVSVYRDRHGNQRYRFRRTGYKSRYIHAIYGTPEFDAEVRAAMMLPEHAVTISRVEATREVRRATRGQSMVYFIAAKCGPIKIGTSTNVYKRLSQLQVGSARPLRLLAMMPGDRETEELLHERFVTSRLDGEWFKRSPDLVAFIADCPRSHVDRRPRDHGGRRWLRRDRHRRRRQADRLPCRPPRCRHRQHRAAGRPAVRRGLAAVSGTLGKVAMVAGLVALAATGAGAIAGAGWGIAGIGSFSSIATAASLAGAAASVGATALAKTPPARGSVSSTTIGSDQPMPFLIGETYYGGSRIHQVGYGPTTNKVPNPYALIVDVYSGAGPVEGLVSTYADFSELPFGNDPVQPFPTDQALGYASGFLWRSVQVGRTPEASALSSQWSGAPGWGAASRLSGYAAIAWSLLFDRKGKVFASGVPQLGAVWRGQKAWDPRRDDTIIGGAGPQRWSAAADTAAHDAARETWTFTECPGLVGLKYALGAYHRDLRVAGSTYRKVAGVGLPVTGVIVEDFIHLANVCDANGWKVGGVVFEPSIGSSSTRWQNLKDILAAGGAEPCFRGGRLGLKISAPRIVLDTITGADLCEDEVVVSSGLGWEERLNTLIPKYRSRDHKWEYVASTEPVSVAAFVSVDGEVKREERQYNLVQQKDQAAQLCAYELWDRRELGEIEIVVKPRLRKYGPGDLLIVDLPDDGLSRQPCVILKRQPLPDRMAWRLTLQGETPGKHAFALGRTAVAPPIPALGATVAFDEQAASTLDAVAAIETAVDDQADVIQQQADLIREQGEALTDYGVRLKKLEAGTAEP